MSAILIAAYVINTFLAYRLVDKLGALPHGGELDAVCAGFSFHVAVPSADPGDEEGER